MRLLLINYRYFVSGGPERYLFNVKGLLEENGHEVIPFSIAYDRNEPSQYQAFFAPPAGGSDAVYFRDEPATPAARLRALERTFYSPTVYRRLAALIAAVRPDAALVLHYLRKLSPSVLKCLADHGIPFSVRLSDFAMVCANAHLLRDSQPCELCVSGNWRHSVRYGCIQGSRAASAVNYAATKFHRRAGLYDLIKTFLVPSRFTISKMIEAGWPSERLVHLPTFVNPVSPDIQVPKSAQPTVAFVGRLEATKGIETLLDAAHLLAREPGGPRFMLRVVGQGEPAYVDSLRSSVERRGLTNIVFEGSKSLPETSALMSRAWFSVVPSLWYENVPNAALESMACGTPVIASDHGSLREIVRHNETGWLARPGDARALASRMRQVLRAPHVTRDVGHRAAAYVRKFHSPDRHYDLLMQMLTATTSERALPLR